MTVDEILAAGQYTDRRGREWFVVGQDSDLGPAWIYNEEPFGAQALIGTHQMRLLIERDQHRDECGELPWCDKHPVPVVIVCHETGEPWGQFKVRAHGKAKVFRTFPEAMGAARAWAVGG